MAEKEGRGRPTEWDKIKLGKEFVAWTHDNPEALTVPDYTSRIEDLNSEIFRSWCATNEQFRTLYKQGKDNIGRNRLKSSLKKNGLSETIYSKTLHFYDCDILGDIHDEKRFDSDLKKAENKEINNQYQQPITQAKEAQIPLTTRESLE